LDDGRGNSSPYRLRRLAREAPEILEAYERGEFKSVAAAARAAGFEKTEKPLTVLRRIWKKASTKEREQIIAWINQQADKNELAGIPVDIINRVPRDGGTSTAYRLCRLAGQTLSRAIHNALRRRAADLNLMIPRPSFLGNARKLGNTWPEIFTFESKLLPYQHYSQLAVCSLPLDGRNRLRTWDTWPEVFAVDSKLLPYDLISSIKSPTLPLNRRCG
jgi:hypothetical protein